MPYFCRLSTKLSCEILKSSLRMFMWMQKSIEFHLSHYEIPKLSSHYSPFFTLITPALQPGRVPCILLHGRDWYIRKYCTRINQRRVTKFAHFFAWYCILRNAGCQTYGFPNLLNKIDLFGTFDLIWPLVEIISVYIGLRGFEYDKSLFWISPNSL